MSTKHTPGPWVVNPVRAQVDATHAPICQLLWPTRMRSEDETESNARLIAAAPELLAALDEIARDYVTPPRLADIARAAIAKAKGQA